jgi:Divergent InlB B-repeat domain
MIGGFAGANFQGVIRNSTTRTDLLATGSAFLGGFVGLNFQGQIFNSISEVVSVDGGEMVGGFAGYNTFGSNIYNSSTISNVSGFQEIGGFVGSNNNNSVIRFSESSGEVDGIQIVGGFVGDNDWIIENSKSSGQVTGIYYTGGFAGTNYFNIIEKSLASGAVRRGDILIIENPVGYQAFGTFSGSNFGQVSCSSSSYTQPAGENYSPVGLPYNGSSFDCLDPSENWLMGIEGQEIGSDSSVTSEIDLLKSGSDVSWDKARFINFGNPFLKALSIQSFYSDATPTLIYESNGHGSVEGSDVFHLRVNHNGDGTPVRATPEIGYHFVRWGDGSRANPRVDLNVGASNTFTAYFEADLINVSDSNLKFSTPVIEEALPNKEGARRRIINSIIFDADKPTPSDFRDLGITGVTTSNLPILLRLLKDLGIVELDPKVIAKQIEIANALLAKQKKAKQALKVKKASLESSSWTSFMPSLLLG